MHLMLLMESAILIRITWHLWIRCGTFRSSWKFPCTLRNRIQFKQSASIFSFNIRLNAFYFITRWVPAILSFMWHMLLSLIDQISTIDRQTLSRRILRIILCNSEGVTHFKNNIFFAIGTSIQNFRVIDMLLGTLHDSSNS